MALLNVRSLTNKTFILGDFFVSRHLDFMLSTETWIRPGECSAFSELVPPGCSFFSSPRTSGKGGGLATVFKSCYNCRQCPPRTFSSFELQLFEICVQSNAPVLCALIYRPPKFNKDFMMDFSDFVAGILLKYHHFLIVGDFNIHVCCDSKPFVKDFLRAIDSFNLVQFVTGPTHEKGHTLDLVLSHGLNVCIQDLCSTQISDHLPVLFSLKLPRAPAKPCALTRTRHVIKSSTTEEFSKAFGLVSTPDLSSSVEDATSMFNSACTAILDFLAPLKTQTSKSASEPWLNDSTRALRR